MKRRLSSVNLNEIKKKFKKMKEKENIMISVEHKERKKQELRVLIITTSPEDPRCRQAQYKEEIL